MWWPSSMYWQVANPQHLCLVQLSVLVVFNAFYSGRRHGEARVADKSVQFVALASVPFRIHQQAQALLEAQFIERGSSKKKCLIKAAYSLGVGQHLQSAPIPFCFWRTRIYAGGVRKG